MQSEDRRSFLATVVTAVSSILPFGAWGANAFSQEARASSSSPPATAALSFDGLYNNSTQATALRGEAADRLALRRLVDAWAHCADRRLAEQQANLFLPEGLLLNYEGDPATHKPVSTLRGRDAIRQALGVLNTFSVTLHMNGQNDVMIHGDRAIGETYCLVHQFKQKDGPRQCQTLGIRYYDQFLRQRDRWYFAERRLIIDWSDTRVSTP
jgi:SnoaL-like domain